MSQFLSRFAYARCYEGVASLGFDLERNTPAAEAGQTVSTHPATGTTYHEHDYHHGTMAREGQGGTPC